MNDGTNLADQPAWQPTAPPPAPLAPTVPGPGGTVALPQITVTPDNTAAPDLADLPDWKPGAASKPAPRSVYDQLTGQTGPRYQLWPEKAARGMWSAAENAFTVPGRVAAGEIAPDSPEAIAAGVTIATMPGLLSPTSPGYRIGSRFGAPPPEAPTVSVPSDVTLSAGQATQQLPLIQAEQGAKRGLLGKEAQDQANAFNARQADQVSTVQSNIGQSLDPYGQTIASSPQDAGGIVQSAIQRGAAAAKQTASDLYTEARAQPGELPASALQTIGTQIRSELPALREPVITDPKLTPYASAAIDDVDSTIQTLQARKAGPYGDTADHGLDLNELDMVRKRLSAYRSQATQSGNLSDARATGAVVDAYDNAIDRAVNSGQFTGDQRAVQAWNAAREAYGDYRAGYTQQGGKDAVGRVIEKIVGNRGNLAAIPNDVADFLYSSSGVNPNTLNRAVAMRVRDLLGEQSPAWSAVKQGLWSRLTETPQGVTDLGPGMIAQRISRFLNGDGIEMAQTLYSPQQRQLMQQFADLNRALQVPPGGANWSETSTFTGPFLKKILGMMGAGVGIYLGHETGLPGGEIVGGLIGKGTESLGDFRGAQQIRRQMPLVIDAATKWSAAVRAFTLAKTPINKIAVATATKGLLRNMQLVSPAMQGAVQGDRELQQWTGPPPGQTPNQPTLQLSQPQWLQQTPQTYQPPQE